jgi:hypothetical protein
LVSSTLYNWQVGYTPDLAVGVWIGNQDNQPVNSANFETANAANRVWRRVMMAGHAGLPARNFTRPPGVVSAPVPAVKPGTGTSGAECTGTTTDLFATGDASEQACVVVRIDKRNGLLASETTPAEFVEERGYLRVPKEEEAWARQHGWLPPTERSTENNLPVRIDWPIQAANISGTTPIRGRASSRDLVNWILEYGEGLTPSNWIQIGGSSSPVENGDLGRLDTASLQPGIYTIRLVVTDSRIGAIPSVVQVNVSSGPPPATMPGATPLPAATPRPNRTGGDAPLPRATPSATPRFGG